GTPAGGVYSGGLGVSGNTFTPSAATVGIDTITYTFMGTGGCSDSAKQPIVVSPAGTLTITPVPALSTNSDPVTLVANIAGGSFSGTGVSGSTFNPAVAGVGIHMVIYSVTGGCAMPDTIYITVNKPICL